MSFNTALSAGNYTTLRGSGAQAPTYQSAVYASLCPNTIIFQALVNQASFAASYASLTFDTVTIGAYTDIVAGMTVIVSPTTDLTSAVFAGRARANNSGVVATATVLNLNETSAAIGDNYVITVLNDFRTWDKLGRQVSGVQYTDYAITFRQLLPVIYGLKSAYAGWISAGVLTISFAPSAFAAASGASISLWLWNVSDGTITVGSTTTQNITVTFPPGHRWITLTVTDSGGRTQTRKISIHAHDPDLYPPIPLQAGDIHVAGSVESGYSGDITAWAGITDVLDNTLIVIWNDEQYQDGTTALTGDNIAFVGRLRQSTDSSLADATVAQIAETRYTLESPMQALARLEMLPYEFLNNSAPDAFFEVKNLTVWRAVCLLLSEFSTFLELHDLTFDSTDDTFLTIGLRTQGNNILAAVNDLYYSINGALQMNAAGQGQCVRDVRMVSSAARSAAVTVANWTTSDLLSIDSYDHPDVKTVGRLISTGGSYITANNQNSVFESLAPGIAQDYPESSASLDRQVLQANQSAPNAQTELNERAGNAFARQQETDKITVTHPDGYAFLVPALDAWYTFTLDGSETVRGIVLTADTRWLLVGIDVGHDGTTGQKTVQATYTRETQGAAGQTVVYPPAPDTPYESPSFPPFDLFPAFPVDPSFYLPPDTNVLPFVGNPDLNQTTAPLDGNSVAVLDPTTNIIYLTTNLITGGANPTWRDVTPPNVLGTLQYLRAEGTQGLYAVSNNGTDSRFHYCANIFADPPVWIDTDLTGAAYDFIRVASTSGGVYVEGITQTGSTCAVDWDVVGAGILTNRTDNTLTVEGEFVAGSYRANISVGGALSTPAASKCRKIAIDDPSSGGTTAYGWVLCGGAYPADAQSGLFINQCVWELEYLRSVPFTVVFTLYSDFECGDCGGSSTTNIAYSSNFGASFASPQTVSPSLTNNPGFDTIKIGIPTLAGGSGQVHISTSAGGVYTPYGTLFPTGGEPNALLLPRYQFGGTVNNTTTNTPHYLAASGTLANDGEALWKVTTSGSLFTGITPVRSSVKGLALSRDSIEMPWQSSAKILEVADFGGTRRLSVTVNTGAAWKFSGALDGNAQAVRVRKGDQYQKQAFVGNGSVVSYCANYQAATLVLSPKNFPGSQISYLDVYG